MVVIAMSGIHVHSCLFVFGNRLHGSIILAATSQFSIYVIRRTELLTVITSQSNTFQDFILICFVAVIGERSHLGIFVPRSEEHTSELQSRENLVCRLLLEKKNANT